MFPGGLNPETTMRVVHLDHILLCSEIDADSADGLRIVYELTLGPRPPRRWTELDDAKFEVQNGSFLARLNTVFLIIMWMLGIYIGNSFAYPLVVFSHAVHNMQSRCVRYASAGYNSKKQSACHRSSPDTIIYCMHVLISLLRVQWQHYRQGEARIVFTTSAFRIKLFAKYSTDAFCDRQPQ